MLTPEQLMMPRYEVIADYPLSIWKVGEILYEKIHGDSGFWQAECYIRQGDVAMENILLNPGDFPHLFRKLSWFDKRKVEDLTLYVKLHGIPYKVSYWEDYLSIIPRTDPAQGELAIKWHFSRKKFLPATETNT